MLLTPPGPAAIAVVRLTGGSAADFLARHFSRPPVPSRAVHGTLRDGETIIDDPLVVLHTGGQAADLSVHGGPWVVRQVLELARREGFTLVETWQFPLPTEAVDGRNEFERRMLSQLPLARTELALRSLLSQTADPSLWWLLHPPRVAIVGAANVGKSTIANQLFAQERSITADVPGTTRDWVGEIADIDGLAVFLMDTPGLRATSDEIERAAIAGSGEQIQQADLVVLVVDGSSPIAEQREWSARYPDALVVRNKCDRSGSVGAIDAARPHVFTVATTGEGIDALRQAIRRRFIRAWRQIPTAGRNSLPPSGAPEEE